MLDAIVVQAMKAINEVFSDSSVSPEETINRMETLAEECEMLLECARDNPKSST